MAGNGPIPKPERQRERDTRRRDAEVRTVRPDGVLRGPELEAGLSYSPATLQWYATWRTSPQAQLFEDTDWLALQLVLPLVDQHYRRASAAAASEIRLVTASLGGTYADRLRLAKIRVEHDDPNGADAIVTPLHAVSKDAIRERMKRPAAPVADPEPDTEEDPDF